MKTPDINKILRADRRSSKYGAPLGCADLIGPESAGRLYVQRVRLVSGDYGPDGTYWGGGRGTSPLYCGFTADSSTRVYVRARTRAEALALVLEALKS